MNGANCLLGSPMLSGVQKLLQGLVILAINPAKITEAFSSTDACCMHLSRQPLQSRAKSGEATQEGKFQAALHGCTLLGPAHASCAQAGHSSSAAAT